MPPARRVPAWGPIESVAELSNSLVISWTSRALEQVKDQADGRVDLVEKRLS